MPGRIASVRAAAALLVDMARKLRVPAAEHNLFEVAIVEALSNAIRHNPRDTGSELHCELELAGRRLTIRVLDDAAAAPLDFAELVDAVPGSDATADSWDTIRESGYGLHLMRAVFPRITPVTRDGRHGVEMSLTF